MRARALLVACALAAACERPAPEDASPYRALDVRLGDRRAERYRPRSAARAAEPRAAPYAHAALARLEAAGDRRGLAAAYAAAGDVARARRVLEALPPGADVASDLGGLLAEEPHAEAAALAQLERALAEAPAHPQALWNRAVLLERLGLPRAAERAFGRVAELGEAGWSDEARARARALHDEAAARTAPWGRAVQEAPAIGEGRLPPEDVLAGYPDLVRTYFFQAVRQRVQPDALLAMARTIDARQGGTALEALARHPEHERRFTELRTPPVTVAKAEEYRRLAERLGDPWRVLRASQLHADALLAEGHGDDAIAALLAATERCPPSRFPDLCAEIGVTAAKLLAERHRMREARAAALAARRTSQIHRLPYYEAVANQYLQAAADFANEFALARAYAEENTLQRDNCSSRQVAREYLAQIALERGEAAEARRQLAAVERCTAVFGGAALPRFDLVAAGVLDELTRDPATGWPEGVAWLAETLAQHRARPHAAAEDVLLSTIEGRSRLLRDRDGAVRELLDAIRAADALASQDDAVESARAQAYGGLIADAAARGDHARALDLLLAARRIAARPACVLGVAIDGPRQVTLARAGGAATGVVEARRGPYQVPPAMRAAVAGCVAVAVVATAPVLGRADLLPGEIAWGYLDGGRRPPPAPVARRLVVSDVRPPDELRLPRLQPVPAEAGAIALRGPAATPARVLDEARAADEIELHVHGIVDPSLADTAALVMSADERGRALVEAREIQRLALPRRPIVVLGACQAATSARSDVLHASLPAAFLRAGASVVLASPAPVEDAEAPAFFAGVLARLHAGAPPPVALRDERASPRWAHSRDAWTRSVVIFY